MGLKKSVSFLKKNSAGYRILGSQFPPNPSTLKIFLTCCLLSSNVADNKSAISGIFFPL